MSGPQPPRTPQRVATMVAPTSSSQAISPRSSPASPNVLPTTATAWARCTCDARRILVWQSHCRIESPVVGAAMGSFAKTTPCPNCARTPSSVLSNCSQVILESAMPVTVR